MLCMYVSMYVRLFYEKLFIMVYTHYAFFHLLLLATLDIYLAFTYNLLNTTKYFKRADRFLIPKYRAKSVNRCSLSLMLWTEISICVNYL